jgi:peptidoglycan-associated lipoprotein
LEIAPNLRGRENKKIPMKKLLSHLFTVFFLSLVITGCKNPTTKGQTGEGGSIDDGLITEAPVDVEGGGDKALGTPEARLAGTPDFSQFKSNIIYFDFDSAMVRSSDYDNLNQVATWAKENPGKKILVAGHCDDRGTLEYNRALSQRRASAAREYLLKKGVPASNVGTVGYGEEQPAESGQTDDAWAKNRRAEFGVVK